MHSVVYPCNTFKFGRYFVIMKLAAASNKMYVRLLHKSISFGGARQRMGEVYHIKQDYCHAFRIERDRVWMKFPLAWVQHLRTDSAG